MKALARGFVATLLGWAQADSDREELRLLPQPVYRYDALARRTSGWLEVRYRDQVVWKAEKDPEWRDPSATYFQLSHLLPPDALDAEAKQPSKRK